MSSITKTVAIALALSFSALAGAHAETAAPFRNGGSALNVNPLPYQSFGSPQPQGVHSTASFGGAAFRPIQPIVVAPISSWVFGGTPLQTVQPIRSISPVSSGPVQIAPVTLSTGIYPERLTLVPSR